MIDKTLGHYKILEKIGAGGMGVVYRARDLHLGRLAALKVLAWERISSPDRKRRFVQEAKAASALNHPHIITIYDISNEGGTDFIAMEYVEGDTLSRLIGSKGLPLNEALDYAVQIVDAIAKAHAAGIIHRDLKPGNIMITREGQVKVLDFGLAKLTEAGPSAEPDITHTAEPHTDAGIIMGTVAYMSPEQAEGEIVDARSDIFSLGSVLYEMVTGRSAFSGGTPLMIIDAIRHKSPILPGRLNPDCPPELERVIGKALEKDRELRYQTAADLIADLRRVKRDSDSGRSEAPSRSGRPVRAATRRKAVVKDWSGKQVRRLAVLPFENASTDPEMEYLSDGITESLINGLSQLPRLQVLARSTVFRFKGQSDPVEAARELDVRAILTGKVVQVRDTLIVSVELVDAESGSHMWGARYQRKAADILEVQDAIAQEISSQLHVRLTSEQKKRLGKRSTGNPEAYRLYLKGRYHWNKWSADGFRKSMEYYQKALQIDPDYALSYAGLADIYSSTTFTDAVGVAPVEQVSKAKEAALKALELDGSLAEAHTALADIKFSYDWEWAAAEKAFKRALELNPGWAHAHHRYSHLLIVLGRMNESLAASLRALELDPLDPEMSVHLAFHYFNARQYDEALESCRSAQEIDPNFHETYWMLGLAYGGKELFEEAITALRRGIALSGESAMERMALGYVYGRAGRKAEAEGILQELNELARRRHVSGYDFAVVYAGQGLKDRALESLERAYRERTNWMPYISVDPRLDSLRSDPRFQDLLRRLDLPG